MSSLVSTKHNGSSKSILHLLRYIVLIMAFLVVGMVNGGSKVEAALADISFSPGSDSNYSRLRPINISIGLLLNNIKMWYCWSEDGSTCYSGSFSSGGEGVKTVTVHVPPAEISGEWYILAKSAATDNGSTTDVYVGGPYNYDFDAPSCSISVDNAVDGYVGGDDVGIDVSIDCFDDHSGISTTYYCVSDTGSCAVDEYDIYEFSFYMDFDGSDELYVHAYAVDNAGNGTYLDSIVVGPFTYDGAAPTITFSSSGSSSYQSDYDIFVMATDDVGVDYVEYCWHNGSGCSNSVYETFAEIEGYAYASDWTDLEEGSIYLHVRAYDVFGNFSVKSAGPFLYDLGLPPDIVSFSPDGGSYEGTSSDGVTVAITLSSGDGLGIDELGGCVSTGEMPMDDCIDFFTATGTSSATFNVLFDSSGTYYIHGSAIDNAGHETNYVSVSEPFYITITEIDSSGPTLSSYSPSRRTYYDDIVSVDITYSDSSGVSTIYYKYSKSGITSCSTSWNTISNGGEAYLGNGTGVYYLYSCAEDSNGNMSSLDSTGPYYMDNTSPYYSGSSPYSPDGLSDAEGGEAVDITYYDADSGVGYIYWCWTNTSAACASGSYSSKSFSSYTSPASTSVNVPTEVGTWYLVSYAVDDAGYAKSSAKVSNAFVVVEHAGTIEEVTSSGTHVAYYDTLSAAFGGATSGNTIRLLEDVSECSISLASGKTLTLDLNGRIVTCSASAIDTSMLRVRGTLTIMDSLDGGAINLNSLVSGKAIYIFSGGVMTLNSGTVDVISTYSSSDSSYKQYGVYNEGTFNMNGGSVSSQKPDYSYGVYNGFTFVMNGGNITSTTVNGDSYGVYANGPVTTIVGGIITSTSTTGTVYGVYNYGSVSSYTTTFGVSDGVVSRTSPEINGGVSQYNSSTSMYFYDGIIKSGYNNFTCYSSNTKCSSVFDAVETGYEWVDDGNEAYLESSAGKIEELTSSGTHVAYYDTLSAAFGGATSGNTIKLLENISECGATLPSDKVLTLNLNGKSITCSTNTNAFVFKVSGNLTIVDSVENGYIGLSTSANINSAVYINVGGVVTLNSGTISAVSTNSSSADYIYGIYNLGTLNVNGGKIYSERSYYSYAVYNSGSSSGLFFNGGLIEAKASTSYAYGVYVESSSSFAMDDGEILSQSNDRSYAVYNTGTFNFNSGSITSVAETRYSYGVYNKGASASYVQSGGNVTSSASTGDSYAVYANGLNTTITGGVITANTTSGSWAGLYAWISYAERDSGFVTTLGVKDGNVSRTTPEINGGLHAFSGAASPEIHFYDGIIKSSGNTFVCYRGFGGDNCYYAFRDKETGYGIVEDAGEAYLDIVIEELDSAGNRVATHATIEEALHYAANNNTIKLLLNRVECSVLYVSSERTLTIDMNGKTISCYSEDESEDFYSFYNEGHLTIIGNGMIEMYYSYDSRAICYLEYDEETDSPYCTGYYDDEYIGTASVIDNYGTLIIDGLTINLYVSDGYLSEDSEATERPNYACGIYNVGQLEFKSGTINVENLEADGQFHDETTYSIYTEKSGNDVLVVIGNQDGSIDVDSPELNGRVYVSSDVSSSVVKFFDGVINKGDTAYICNFGDSCASIFGVIESGASWIVDNGSAYIAFLYRVEELTSSGTHVAYYENLSSAFSNATNGNKIKLLSNIEECSINLDSGRILTLDLNGKSITCNTDVEAVGVLSVSGNLTIKDSATGGSINLFTSYRGGYGVQVDEGAIVTLNSGTINSVSTHSALGNGYGINNNGTLNITGGKIYSEKAIYAYGVYNSGSNARVILSGGEIETKAVTTQGYGIRNRSGAVFEMTGGKIVVNAGSPRGVYNDDLATFIMSGGEIISNGLSSNDSYGVYNSGTFNMVNGSITGAVGDAIAYILYIDGDASVTNIGAKDGDISLDSPIISGYVYIDSASTFNFYDGKISNQCYDGENTIDFTTLIDETEDNVMLELENGYWYLFAFVPKVEELTSGGVHVANYFTLQDAFDGASSGNTLKLLDNVNECNVTLNEARRFVLNMNGRSLICDISSGNSEEEYYSLVNDGDLTIVGNGYLYANNIMEESVYGLSVSAIRNTGNMVVENITITATSLVDRATGVVNLGALEFIGATINCTADYYVYGISNSGSLNMQETVLNLEGTMEEYGISNSGTLVVEHVTLNLADLGAGEYSIGISNSSTGTLDIVGHVEINVPSTSTFYDYSISNYGVMNIGVKDGNADKIPVIDRSMFIDESSTINFYDGKIVNECYVYPQDQRDCKEFINEIEDGSTLKEEDGFIYLKSGKQYNMFQEVDSDGNLISNYVTLSDAVSNSRDGSVIKFIGNVFECVSISTGKTLTFDLNGKTLGCSKVNGSGNVVAIVNNGNLTIIGNGSITVSGDSTNTYAVYNSGTLNISGGFISATASSAIGVYSASGNVTISGGTIRSNSTSGSGSAIGVRVDNGSINISGGVISSASDVGDVYGVFNSGTFSMSKGVISATSNLKNARGVYNSSGTSTVTGGAISSVSSLGEAYGVSASDTTAVSVSATSSITATSTFGIAQELKEETIDDLINIPGGNDKAPKLYYDVVEGIDSPVICNYGSICDVASLVFVDYEGVRVDDITTTIKFNGDVVNDINTRVLGTYIVTSVARDSYGNVSKEVVRTYNIVDNEAPVIKVSKDAIVLKVGDSISGLYGATASDNYDTDLVIEVLDDEIDTSKEGTYKLGYKVVDSSGNETIVYRNVVVKDSINNNIWIYIGIGLGLILIGLVGFVVLKRRF